jgi:wyosine [tRNA(Phe)-imidazoG37] synthetase (radical SAM superfamily)
MSTYTFGPIQSRRFGLSLGIDLSPDAKSCNFDCLYCELSRAKVTDIILNPPSVDDIIKDVQVALLKFPDIEVITITSNGEPTLYTQLDSLIEALNSIKGNKKLLILTNSSTIVSKKVQESLKKLDIVKCSLDCVDKECFKKIDRPLKNIDINDIIKGLIEFRKIFKNELIIEVLIVKNVNDNILQMQKLNDVLQKISPDRVDLGTIDRPPSYNVLPVDPLVLNKLGEVFTNIAISIVHKHISKNRLSFTKDEIFQMLKRRPQSEFDVDSLFSESTQKLFNQLQEKNEIFLKNVAGVNFYTLEEIKTIKGK